MAVRRRESKDEQDSPSVAIFDHCNRFLSGTFLKELRQ
jgi:hypothetical protein